MLALRLRSETNSEVFFKIFVAFAAKAMNFKSLKTMMLSTEYFKHRIAMHFTISCSNDELQM